MPTPQSALPANLLGAIEAGATIVAPTQRAAHWLKLLYANHALDQGRKAWATPAIHSFNAFVLQLWNAFGTRTDRVLTREQSELLWEHAVVTSRWSSLLLSLQSAASTSFRSWEQLQDWRIARADLDVFDGTASDETRAFLEWGDRFQKFYTERSWLPVALLPHRLLQREITSPAHIVVAASEVLPSQQALFAHLAGQGARVERLDSPEIDSQLETVKCESQERELQAAAQWARQQMLSGKSSIGVIVPELSERAAQARRVFAEVFAQDTRVLNSDGADRAARRQSFSLADYHRLADFPIVRAALDVLALAAGRASASLVGGIVRNPFLRASVQEGARRAQADLRIRAHPREQYDLALLEPPVTSAECAVLGACLREAYSIHRAAPNRALPSRMAELFIGLWRALGWPGDATLDSDEQQIVARLQKCLGEFGALDELFGPLPFARSVHEFEQLLRNTNFEPRSLPTPITLVDARGVDALRFEVAWVAGMDATRWPPPAAPDSFIPIELQRRARMPYATASLARESAHAQFRKLQGIADTVVMSWASQEEGLAVAPSPWLSSIVPSSTVNGSSVANSKNYAARVFAAKPQLEILEEQRAPAFAKTLARGGARIFELQSRCPFRAFAELRLLAQPLVAVSSQIDARERGTLIHAALADLWQTLKDSEGLQSQSVDQLEVLVRTALARHAAKLFVGASPRRVRMLQIEQDLAAERLLELFELERQRLPFRVVGRPETKEQITLDTLTFELRLDRVDELVEAIHDGARIIVDYKTGNAGGTQSWFQLRPERPQLPLYAVTHPQKLAAVAFAVVSAKTVAYQGVARDKNILPGVKSFNEKNLPPPHAGWGGVQGYWQIIIARLAGEFAMGEARVDPLPTACRDCHLLSLCRLNEKQLEGFALTDEEPA